MEQLEQLKVMKGARLTALKVVSGRREDHLLILTASMSGRGLWKITRVIEFKELDMSLFDQMKV